MLSNVLNVGKDIANKLNNKILNLSEIEIMIKDATNDEPWGPQSSLLKEIARETFSSLNFNEIMTFLWYRIFTERPANKRRTYKGLILLSYMMIHGSDFVSIRCRDHLSDIQSLENFSDSNGIPDYAVRKKASDICDLINDADRLRSERDKAVNSQLKIYGQTSDSVNKARPQSIETSFGDFDSWQPKSKSIPYVIGESFINFVNTFTQNISGPPPTETHDNFELPTYYDTATQLNAKKDTQLSVDVTNSCSNNQSQITKKIDAVAVPPPVQHGIADNEVPIIDFSDDVTVKPAYDYFSTDFGMEFDNCVHGVVPCEDDFGDFRGWNNNRNHEINVMPEKPNCNSQTNYFYSDNDCFENVVTHSNNISKITESRKENASKADLKVGSTWNDIGSLQIDLDNVCGIARRPMTSTKT